MDIEDYGPRLSALAFLEIDFGERIKAELDNGEIKTLVRGPRGRAMVQTNLVVAIAAPIRGTGRYGYGTGLMLMTGTHSVRHPDVAIYEHREATHTYGDRDLMSDPLVVGHVLSDPVRTARMVAEYRQIETLRSLVLVNHEQHTVRHLHRIDTGTPWTDETVIDLELPSLALTIPHTEIFARD